MRKYKAITSKQTHAGKALACFGLSRGEDGSISLMRWVQTPYMELATPPQVFDLSVEEWLALQEEVKA